MEHENTHTHESYLSFKLGNDIFAAHVSKVLNILEIQPITHVPKSPAYLKGVTNLRGSVLPVLDTRTKLGMPSVEYTPQTCILVLDILIDGEPVSTGALVDSVSEVFETEDNKLMHVPEMGIQYDTQYIEGILKHKNQFVVVLDLEKVFGGQDIISLHQSVDEE